MDVKDFLNMTHWAHSTKDILTQSDIYYAWIEYEAERDASNIPIDWDHPEKDRNEDDVRESEEYDFRFGEEMEYFPADFEPVPEWVTFNKRLDKLIKPTQ
jgi:hypothetical protein